MINDFVSKNLLSIYHIGSRFSSCRWKDMHSKQHSGQFVRLLSIKILSTAHRFTRVECQPMIFVLSNVPFHCSPKCQYFPWLFSVQWLFNDILHVRTIWKKLTQWNTNLMLFSENVFRIVSYPISPAATEGTYSGLWSSVWSSPLSSILVLLTFEPSSNFVNFINLFQHIGYGWIAMFSYAQRYFLPSTYCYLQNRKIAFIPGKVNW